MPVTMALSSFAGLAAAAPFASLDAMQHTGPQSGMFGCSVPSAQLTTLAASSNSPVSSAAVLVGSADQVRPIAA